MRASQGRLYAPCAFTHVEPQALEVDIVIPINAAQALSTDDDFRALERTRLRALVDRNLELAAVLHSPEFHLITPRGSIHTRESYLRAVQVGDLVYVKWEAATILVRRTGSVALLRYQAELEMPREPEASSSFFCWHTDSYERPVGAWQVVWSQATLVRQETVK